MAEERLTKERLLSVSRPLRSCASGWSSDGPGGRSSCGSNASITTCGSESDLVVKIPVRGKWRSKHHDLEQRSMACMIETTVTAMVTTGTPPQVIIYIEIRKSAPAGTDIF